MKSRSSRSSIGMSNGVYFHIKRSFWYTLKFLWHFDEQVLYCTTGLLKSRDRRLGIEDVKAQRRKDTIFIMGSGYSVNDITQQEWQHIANVGDTFSFNEFFKGKFVPIDYHIFGELGRGLDYRPIAILMNTKYIKGYFEELFSNPCYKNTIYFLRYRLSTKPGPKAMAIWALYYLKAFDNKPVCLYRVVHGGSVTTTILKPSDSIYAITHVGATLFDSVNIAYILGYKKIVLVGVDLYDSRYFWLGPEQTHEASLKLGRKYSDPHATAESVVRGMSLWREHLAEKGVTLYVYNPRSLLNEVLPVYEWQKSVATKE